MHYLTQIIQFPDVTKANSDGLLAIGGDLSPERLLLAYKSGIFPWFTDGDPILWWTPDPRFVLFPEKLIVSKSMSRVLKNSSFKVTLNKDFHGVINACAQVKRDGQAGTWITKNMIEAYTKLHELGYAKSIEVWENEDLVAGFYGIDLGDIFCGESMFSKVTNASKAGFMSFIQNSNYKLIDCQVYTRHFESLGAEDISRAEFLKYLNRL